MEVGGNFRIEVPTGLGSVQIASTLIIAGLPIGTAVIGSFKIQ